MSYYHHQPPMPPYGQMGPYGGPPPPSGYPPGAPTPPTPSMPPAAAGPYGGGAFGMPLPHGYPHPSPYPPAYPFSLQPSFPPPYGFPPGPPLPPPYFGAHGGAATFPSQPPYGGQPGHPYGGALPPHPSQQNQQPPPQMSSSYGQSHSQLMQQSASAGVPLDPYGLPLVNGDPSVQYPQQLRVEEKIISATRDSFAVYDAQGSMRYKVDGLLSIHERKIMKDIHGQILLKLREARMKFRDKITIFNAQNSAILTLQKASAIQIGSKRVHGYWGEKTTGIPALVITGNTHNTHFHVMNSHNIEVAEIHRRKFSWKNMLTDQDTYHVTVNYGSPALLCFVTIALDEIYED